MNLFWNYIADRRLFKVERDASNLQGRAQDNAITTDYLQDEVDRLTLICRSMWEILKKRVGVTDPELLEMVQEVDLLDGRLDGKFKKSKECPGCHRKMNRRHSRCVYCGAEGLIESAFDAI